MPAQLRPDLENSRPALAPTEQAKPLFETALVGVGVLHLPPDHPEWRAEKVGYRWPSIGLARVPYELRVEGHAPFVMDRNTVMFKNVGAAFRRRGLTERGLMNEWVDIHPELLADILTDATGRTHEPDGRFPWASGFAPSAPSLWVHSIVSLLERSGGVAAMEIEEKLVVSLGSMVRETAKARMGARERRGSELQVRYQREAVDEVKRRLALEPARDPGLSELSKAVHLSPFHLCRVFKRHTGLPIHRYLERLRLRSALEHVLHGDGPMSRVASATGFWGGAHLSKSFSREFGIAPSRMRRDPKLGLKGCPRWATQPAK